MRFPFDFRLMVVALAASAVLSAQVAPSRVIGPPDPPQQPQQQPPQPRQHPPHPAHPGASHPQNPPATNAPRLTDSGAFMMPNASLTEMIALLAQRLKINYILDPAVKGRSKERRVGK